MEHTSEFHSGFVAVVGPTNSGKSTLTNALVGKKVSIVSPKAQTTYHGVRGILNSKHYQIIFTDTPGFQRHPDSVARMLNKVADRNAGGCDILLWVFDASTGRVIEQIEKLQQKIEMWGKPEDRILALNKVDKVPKPELLPMLAKLFEMNLFSEVIPISAKTQDGIDRVLKAVKAKIPDGPAMYPEGMITDRSQEFQIAEMVREKIYESTYQELPYSAWVEVEHRNDDSRIPTIHTVVHVDSESRKAILIGKGGEMLKRIGIEARKDIEKLLKRKICLKLHVDVKSNWKSDDRFLDTYLELN